MQLTMTKPRRSEWRYRGQVIQYDDLHRDYQKFPEETLNTIQEGLESGALQPEDFNLPKLAQAVMGKELFQHVIDGPEGFGSLGWQRTRAQEAGAVELGDFANITGQIYFSAVLNAYEMEKAVFSDIIPTRATMIPGVEKLPGISNLGDGFEIVKEADQFPLMGVSEDWIQIAEKRKRGAIVPVTKEAIKFDLTGVLLRQCSDLGRWLKINREKRVIDAVIDQNGAANSIYAGGSRYQWKGTSYATYQGTTPWVNLATTNGLTNWKNFNTALILMSKIVDPYTGEPFPIEPMHVIVAPDKLFDARRVIHATEVREADPGYATTGSPVQTIAPNPIEKYEIVSSRLLGARMDAASEARTDWFLGNLSEAFAVFVNWDVTPEQAAPNSHEAFYRDIISAYKISTRDCVATIQPRVMFRSAA
jgi:hypothetical protein